MMAEKLIGYAAIAYILFQWLGKGVAAQLSGKYVGLRFDRFTSNGAEFRIAIELRNKTPLPIPIDQLEGALLYQGAVVSRLSSGPFDIPANDVTVRELNVLISYSDLPTLLDTIIESEQLTTEFSIELTVASKGVTIPLSFSVYPLAF